MGPGSDAGAENELLIAQPTAGRRLFFCWSGSRLNVNRVDTVIVTGCTTSGCVRATVVDALQYGYRPIVVRDAVGDRSLASHDQSLFDMEQKYADVLDASELIAYMQSYTAIS